MANTFLQRNFTNTPTSQTIMTYSFWVKKSALATGNSNKGIFGHLEIGNAGNSNLQVGWTTNNDFQIGYYSNNGSDTHIDYVTNAQFKDNNGWYHVCIEINTTLATADDRVKLYINGVLVTSYSTRSNPPQNRTINTGNMYMYIGQYRQTGGTEIYLDGLLSEFIHSDGYAYSASTFGETDTDTGEWRIKDNPTFTPGNQGFKILSNGSTITDQSAGSNDFTVAGGTLTNTLDCPANVFATLNPLVQSATSFVSASGNNKITFNNSGSWGYQISTIGSSTGKYYAEFKVDAKGTECMLGVMPMDSVSANQGGSDFIGKEAGSVGYNEGGTIYKENASVQSGLGSISNGEILGVAMDMDNNTVQFYLQGVSRGSAVSLDAGSIYGIGVSGYGGTTISCNFGNGTFGTTAVTSAGTAGSTPGTFEYDVPAGYEPLSTKGLNA